MRLLLAILLLILLCLLWQVSGLLVQQQQQQQLTGLDSLKIIIQSDSLGQMQRLHTATNAISGLQSVMFIPNQQAVDTLVSQYNLQDAAWVLDWRILPHTLILQPEGIAFNGTSWQALRDTLSAIGPHFSYTFNEQLWATLRVKYQNLVFLHILIKAGFGLLLASFCWVLFYPVLFGKQGSRRGWVIFFKCLTLATLPPVVAWQVLPYLVNLAADYYLTILQAGILVTVSLLWYIFRRHNDLAT